MNCEQEEDGEPMHEEEDEEEDEEEVVDDLNATGVRGPSWHSTVARHIRPRDMCEIRDRPTYTRIYTHHCPTAHPRDLQHTRIRLNQYPFACPPLVFGLSIFIFTDHGGP